MARVDDDERVSNFGYFLRFIMRKKRLRAPQVAALLGWRQTYVEKLTYGTEPPPDEDGVERLVAALNCDEVEADGLRLFSAAPGSYVGIRRRMDERAAELFEAKAALEERTTELEALKLELARLRERRAAPPEGGGAPGPAPVGSDGVALWKTLGAADRALVRWLIETGALAEIRALLGKAGFQAEPPRPRRSEG